MNKRQLDIVHVLIDGAAYGNLTRLIEETIGADPAELAVVAKTVLAAAKTDEEAHGYLSKLRMTLLRACDRLEIPRLTVSNASGSWSVVESQSRPRFSSKLETLIMQVSEIAASMTKQERIELIDRFSQILNPEP